MLDESNRRAALPLMMPTNPLPSRRPSPRVANDRARVRLWSLLCLYFDDSVTLKLEIILQVFVHAARDLNFGGHRRLHTAGQIHRAYRS